ncbi:hypothetical protein FXO38_07065, partial [Capsicum annuum]
MNTWARVILSRRLLYSTTTAKLPLVIYIHKGGFIWGTLDTPILKGLYGSASNEIPVTIISIEYYQAPKHMRIAWKHCIKNKPNELLASYTDFSKYFHRARVLEAT